MNYDLSPKEAALIDAYRELPSPLRENVYAVVTSLCDLRECAARVLSGPENPAGVEGREYADEAEGRTGT